MSRRRGYKRYSAEFKREALKRASAVSTILPGVATAPITVNGALGY